MSFNAWPDEGVRDDIFVGHGVHNQRPANSVGKFCRQILSANSVGKLCRQIMSANSVANIDLSVGNIAKT